MTKIERLQAEKEITKLWSADYELHEMAKNATDLEAWGALTLARQDIAKAIETLRECK